MCLEGTVLGGGEDVGEPDLAGGDLLGLAAVPVVEQDDAMAGARNVFRQTRVPVDQLAAQAVDHDER